MPVEMNGQIYRRTGSLPDYLLTKTFSMYILLKYNYNAIAISSYLSLDAEESMDATDLKKVIVAF
jgi:hypothetical protein